jgi:hypothetical protein
VSTTPGESTTTPTTLDEPATPAAEPSLHEKILTEFVDRLRRHEDVGDEVASAIASLVQGAKMPKRDAIAETLRKTLDAKAKDSGNDPAP